MNNETLIKIGKDILKSLLSNCNESERRMFNRMYSSENIDASIDDAVDNIEPNKIDLAITQCESTLKKGNRPYLIDSINVRVEYKYNPDFGDDKECECGHPYYRHFDTYENMSIAGCKYCFCGEFVEKRDETKLLKK